jgi:hypothetical protein
MPAALLRSSIIYTFTGVFVFFGAMILLILAYIIVKEWYKRLK